MTHDGAKSTEIGISPTAGHGGMQVATLPPSMALLSRFLRALAAKVVHRENFHSLTAKVAWFVAACKVVHVVTSKLLLRPRLREDANLFSSPETPIARALPADKPWSLLGRVVAVARIGCSPIKVATTAPSPTPRMGALEPEL